MVNYMSLRASVTKMSTEAMSSLAIYLRSTFSTILGLTIEVLSEVMLVVFPWVT